MARNIHVVNTSTFPNLFQFFGGSLHLDFLLEFEDWQNAVDSFVQTAADGTLNATKIEFENLLSLGFTEDELIKAIMNLHGTYDPRIESVSVKEWIEYIRKALNSRCV